MNSNKRALISTRSLRPPYAFIALISAAMLAYQLLLMRLLAIVHWHHFAGLVISLALLGFAVSGTLMSVLSRRQLNFSSWFSLAQISFALTAFASFLIAQSLPFNALALLWDNWQLVYWLAIYAALALPFLAAGFAIVLSLTAFPTDTGKLYAADLIGAGVGAILLLFSLQHWLPMQVLLGLSLLVLLAAAVFAASAQRWAQLLAALLMVSVLLLLPGEWKTRQLSEYKPLPQTLLVPGSRIVSERSNALALLSLVDSGKIPFRHAPDLSLLNTAPIPQQLALFADGEIEGALSHYNGEKSTLDFLQHIPAALPYFLQPKAVHQVLVLGSPGIYLLLAERFDVPMISIVSANPALRDWYQHEFAEFVGRAHWQSQVQWSSEHPRIFLARTPTRFDLIQFSVDQASGIAEHYLYTLEALNTAWQRLHDNGWLSLHLPLRQPPLALLKMLAMSRQMLRDNGVADPAAQIIVVQGVRSVQLLIGRQPPTSEQLSALQRFTASNAFQLLWPMLSKSTLPLQTDIAMMMSGNAEAFIERYPFELRAASDDRPYFFHFFQYQSALSLFALREQGGLALLDWAYPLLWLSLLQALLLSGLLVLLPLYCLKPKVKPISHENRWPRWRQSGYFLCIGLAFMALEIAFIQKYRLLLGEPLYAAAVVLASILIGAGIGSYYSAGREHKLHAQAFVWLLCIALLQLWLWLAASGSLLALPLAMRWLLAMALMLLLAFWMGVPMPLGLAKAAAVSPHRLPIAWAVNGSASVIGALASNLLAIETGFTGIIVAALLLYAAAAWLYR